MSADAPDCEGQWIKAARSEEIAESAAIEVLLEGQILAILRHDGTLFALDGMCAHQGGPLSEGIVEHGCVTCPWHGWQYELATGIQTVNRQPLQRTFDVRERDGIVEVWIEKADGSASSQH